MNDTLLRLLVLILVFASVVLLIEALVSGVARLRGNTREINQRLSLISHGRTREEAFVRLRRHDLEFAQGLPLAARGIATAFERTLATAGIGTPTSQLLLLLAAAPVVIMALIIVIMLMAGSPVGFGRLLLVGTIAVALGLVVPLLWLQARAQRRRRRMQEQFPVALDVFVRGLRAGHPVAAALDLLTTEMPDPLGSEFGTVVDEVTYGADLRDALFSLAERWDLEDMRMFVVSLAVQQETGGNLAEILENLSGVIRDRASMLMKVRALSSEGRMTAIMLTLLPVITLASMFMVNPGFYLEVADDPLFVPGFGILIFLYVVGYFAIRRMVDLKV